MSPTKVALITGRNAASATQSPWRWPSVATLRCTTTARPTGRETVAQLERLASAPRRFSQFGRRNPCRPTIRRDIKPSDGSISWSLLRCGAEAVGGRTTTDVRGTSRSTLGTFLCCQRAGLMMAERPEGGASSRSATGPSLDPTRTTRPISPARAIPAITRTLAVGWPSGTGRSASLHPARPGDAAREPVRARSKGSVAGTLLKRPGKPENVAQAVVFLVENDYITGVCLPVDGGRTIEGGT